MYKTTQLDEKTPQLNTLAKKDIIHNLCNSINEITRKHKLTRLQVIEYMERWLECERVVLEVSK